MSKTPPISTRDDALCLGEVLRLCVQHSDGKRLKRVVVYGERHASRTLSITHCWYFSKDDAPTLSRVSAGHPLSSKMPSNAEKQ